MVEEKLDPGMCKVTTCMKKDGERGMWKQHERVLVGQQNQHSWSVLMAPDYSFGVGLANLGKRPEMV